jgi:hypothetical protein
MLLTRGNRLSEADASRHAAGAPIGPTPIRLLSYLE